MPSDEILPILENKMMPRTADIRENHFVVARSTMQQRAMPQGAKLSAIPIKGKRVIRRDSRSHANKRLHIADWPEANLHEIVPPKIACIVSGTADYLLGKYNVRCGEGIFILIPAGAPHQSTGPFLQHDNLATGKCQLVHAYAYSQGVFVWLSASDKGQHHNNYTNNYLIPNLLAANIFNLMMEEGAEAKDGFEVVCNGLLSAFFAIVKREIEAGHYSRSSPKASDLVSTHSDDSFGDQLKEHISANCHKPLQLTGVASHFYMSPAQFTRRIRQETGVTFVEILTAARIERAKELLRDTDWTFTAIASFCSFKSSSYFLHLFHQRVGCTPMDYRAQSRKKS
jgi:AraC-like DNA-binding protein/mannose-6-phosphate isomerase-like protein (cupin superfamily)